jgi:uncharacterized protein (TIGR02246 family)
MTTEADVEAIKTLVKQYDDTVTADDLEGYVALFSEDCVVLPPNAPVVEGKNNYRSWIRSAIFEVFDVVELNDSLEETEIVGDWAFTRASYSMKLKPKAGGETAEDSGKAMVILKRQSDKSWKISHSMWNSNNPPPE